MEPVLDSNLKNNNIKIDDYLSVLYDINSQLQINQTEIDSSAAYFFSNGRKMNVLKLSGNTPHYLCVLKASELEHYANSFPNNDVIFDIFDTNLEESIKKMIEINQITPVNINLVKSYEEFAGNFHLLLSSKYKNGKDAVKAPEWFPDYDKLSKSVLYPIHLKQENLDGLLVSNVFDEEKLFIKFGKDYDLMENFIKQKAEELSKILQKSGKYDGVEIILGLDKETLNHNDINVFIPITLGKDTVHEIIQIIDSRIFKPIDFDILEQPDDKELLLKVLKKSLL